MREGTHSRKDEDSNQHQLLVIYTFAGLQPAASLQAASVRKTSRASDKGAQI